MEWVEGRIDLERSMWQLEVTAGEMLEENYFKVSCAYSSASVVI